MSDEKTLTIANLKETFAHFIKERDWQQFHTPKNLSMALAAEAAELMELFLWCASQESFAVAKTKQTEFEHELADVFMYCIALANATDTNLAKAIQTKMALNAQKYPADKCKGKADKYTAYQDCKK